MQLRSVFFPETELCPLDPLLEKQSLFSLICYTLTRMEVVGKKIKKIFSLFLAVICLANVCVLSGL